MRRRLDGDGAATAADEPAGGKNGGGEEEDGGDDRLRPKAVDAPLLDDVGLEIGEHGGEEEADLGEEEEEAHAAEEGGQGHKAVADDAEGGNGNVELAAVGGFVKGAGREVGEAGVVDGAAVEALGNGAGRGGCGVLIVDAQGEDADVEAGDG